MPQHEPLLAGGIHVRFGGEQQVQRREFRLLAPCQQRLQQGGAGHVAAGQQAGAGHGSEGHGDDALG
ncbi:hypothetical protein Acidovoranil_01100 [Acidovorax sp. FG27]